MRDLGIYEEVEGGGAATEEEDERKPDKEREMREGRRGDREMQAVCFVGCQVM